MKTPILLFCFAISLTSFGQKKSSFGSVNIKSSSPKQSVRSTPRVSTPSSSHSAPSIQRHNTRKPSSSSTPYSSAFEAQSIQRHNTRNPAPHTVNSSNTSSDRNPVVNSSTTNNSTSTSSSSGTNNTSYYSQSSGSHANTGYYSTYGPIVTVSGTRSEYDRLSTLTGGQYVEYGHQQLVRALEDVIIQNANDSTDIVILVDISGSMGNNIKSITKESNAILSSMPFGSRLGGATFKFSKSLNWFNFSDLNEDHQYAMDFITKKRKYFSSESHYDALLRAIKSNTWKNRKRMVITITDEFIESGENFNSETTVVAAANAKDVELYTIMLKY